MDGQEFDSAQHLFAIQGFSILEPTPKIGDDFFPTAGDIASGHVSMTSPAKSASSVRGYSRRPLSESELEFLSYENAGVSSAESRISSAISDSKHQNQIAIAESVGISVSEFNFSPENHSRFHTKDIGLSSSTSPSRNNKSELFDGGATNTTGPLTNASSTVSASCSYIQSLAASIHVLEESLYDERKFLLISQHQHHSSVAKIAELERALEHLQAQFLRTESVNQRIMERSQMLESAMHAWNFQKMTQDSEVCKLHCIAALCAPLSRAAHLCRMSHMHLHPSLTRSLPLPPLPTPSPPSSIQLTYWFAKRPAAAFCCFLSLVFRLPS
jgi:hypothetical protein